MARNKVFLIGNHSMQWDVTHTIAANQLTLDGKGDSLTHSASLGLGVLRIVGDVGPDAAENLWLELDFFDRSNCSDDRDRVATFQWRLDQATNGFSSFRTDYGLSTEDNYAAFARSIVHFTNDYSEAAAHAQERSDRLSIRVSMLQGLLERAAARQHGQPRGRLPTWVPDWRRRPNAVRWFPYAQISTRLPQSLSAAEKLPRRRLQFVAWHPLNDQPKLQGETLALTVHPLASLDVLTTGSALQDGDVVVISMYVNPAHDLGFLGIKVTTALVVRPLRDTQDLARLVDATASIFVLRGDQWVDAWELERLPSGTRASRIRESLRADGRLRATESMSVPQLGLPARKVVYYSRPDGEQMTSSLVIF